MIYFYKAKKLTGEEIEGEIEAKDHYDLARLLKNDGYIIISFHEKSGKIKRFSFLDLFTRVPVYEKMNFSRNLSVMISAGISLYQALNTISSQTNNAKLKKILKSVAEKVKKGDSFAESLKQYGNVFSPLFIAMVAAGEKSGKLSEILNLSAEQLKREYELKRKIKGALVYPAIIIAAMAGIGILMMVYVVPVLVSTFQDLGVELPATTKFIINLSNFITENGFLFFAGLIVFIIAIAYLARVSASKALFDYAILRVPFVSGIVKKVNTARTARTLGSLLESGVNILESMEICVEVLQNKYYKNILKEAKVAVEKGDFASKVFLKYPKLYPFLLGEMTAVGEETGKISEMLFKVADFYENEVAAATKDLSTVIEPILMVIIGVVVGFFAISMIQPMYSMMGGL